MATTCYKWSKTNIRWKNADWKWSECRVVAELIQNLGGVDATTLIQPWLEEPWNPYKAGEKKKKLIKLICRIKGQKYDESKQLKDIKVTVEDIKMVLKKVANIDLDLKREE